MFILHRIVASMCNEKEHVSVMSNMDREHDVQHTLESLWSTLSSLERERRRVSKFTKFRVQTKTCLKLTILVHIITVTTGLK